MTDGCRSARDGIFLYTLSLFYSAVVYLRVGSSLSPVIMTGTTCHREGIVPPRRKVYIFRRLLSASDFVKQTALTAFGAISLFGFKQSGFSQVVERTSHGGLRQLQLRGDGGDRRPTFAVFVGSVGKVP